MLKTISSKFTPVKILIIAGIIVLAISAVSWWRMVYSSPANVFNRMLANSLATSSVTKTVKQGDDTQKLDQTSILVAEPKQVIRSISVLGQTADASTSITTESIGTPTVDFVRYTDIKTSQKNAEGKPFNFSSVLGTWGKADQNDPNSGGAQLFNQTVLGVVPIANLPQPLRTALVKQIKESGVYKTDTSSAKRQLINGRPVYSYDVSVVPEAYVSMLKTFAHGIGLKQLEQVDPAQYKDSAPLKFVFDIDVWSGELIKVAYQSAERTEAYSGYGARVQIETPISAIGVNDLQTRLQQIR